MIKNIKVPTGNICVIKGDKGLIEFLSIGDYGKNSNIKADFLGITREINGVPNGEIMPLSEKWVITISTQYGCSMNCKFCDVPKVGHGLNATINDLNNQLINKNYEIEELKKYCNELQLNFSKQEQQPSSKVVERESFSDF